MPWLRQAMVNKDEKETCSGKSKESWLSSVEVVIAVEEMWQAITWRDE